METLPSFTDAEDVALALLEHLAPTRLSTPSTLSFPLIVVRRVGGFDDYITDAPLIQVDAFGADRRRATDLAEACRQAMLAAPATAVAGVSIDSVRTESAPTFVAYDDRNTQRYVGTYRIALRRAR